MLHKHKLKGMLLMKYFICNIDNNSSGFAIPSEYIERIIPSERKSTSVFETEDKDIFISIPRLLRLKENAAPHGLVLKTTGSKKILLLTPKIYEELEIPEEEIKDLPITLKELLVFFKGVCFIDQKLVFILEPNKLDKRVHND